MIEHSESAFYHPDEIEIKENRECTKLYNKRIGTRQDKGNYSQEETETFFDEQKSMHTQQRKQSVTFGW